MTTHLFVTLEGPDGSGKSTQARLLAGWLRSRGATVIETREPGGTPLGERVRSLALDPDGPPASPLALALLMSASRAQLLSDVVLPALGRGEWVVCDRYADSTLAYQGYGLGLDVEVVRDMTAIATEGITPDITVLVDVPVEVGLRRISARGKGNRLDAETVRFHRMVREGYHRLAAEEPERWLVVDGEREVEAVHAAIRAAIEARIESEGE